MPRPQRCRRVCREPEFACFLPEGAAGGEQSFLSVDEFEVLRLVDYEKMTHEQCAQLMDISRTTVTEICENARRKVMDALLHGKKLLISGGNYRLCQGEAAGMDCGCGNSECRCHRKKGSGEDCCGGEGCEECSGEDCRCHRKQAG